jgi:hypothetical protein
MQEKSRQHYIPASHFALAYSGLGEDETMTWLERAYEEHNSVDGRHQRVSGLGCFAFRTAISGSRAPHEFSAVASALKWIVMARIVLELRTT